MNKKTDISAQYSPNSNGKFLIIDDNTMLSDLIHYNFSPMGFGVDRVGSLAEFLTIERDRHYECVLVDLDIDGGVGMQIVELINTEHDPSRHLPVIICGSADKEDELVTALSVGADDFIMRPYSVSDVKRRISAILGI